MNDFDYDVMQKKRIAASARRRVCGSKSRYVGLPSDHLTPAQIKKRSGPCMSYQLNMPMDWATFKSMPKDLQQSYLDGLSSRFGVTAATIGKELFGLSHTGMSNHIRKNGLQLPGGSKLSNAEREIWENWLSPVADVCRDDEGGCSMKELAPFTTEPGQLDVDRAVTLSSSQEEPLEVSELAATFTGKFDPERFMKWVAMLPMPDAQVRIRVEVTRM